MIILHHNRCNKPELVRRHADRKNSGKDRLMGWSDAPPFCEQVGGDVVNIAINHYVHADMSVMKWKTQCFLLCDVPIGSGLGLEINVALMAVIKGADNSEELAYQFEKLLGNHGGVKINGLHDMVNSASGVHWKQRSEFIRPPPSFGG